MFGNKKAEGYIFPCVLIIIICMILSVCITFVNAVNVIKISERNTRVVLDSFVMENSIEIYDSIKMGNNEINKIDKNKFITKYCEFCTLEKRGNQLYNMDENGKVQYLMTVPWLKLINENELRVCAQYTITVPVFFAGVKVMNINVPITVESRFNEKF